MFEAAIMPAVAGTGEDLRPLDWRELSARFDAARDLRALIARPHCRTGSFVGGAQAGLSGEFRAVSGFREQAVNLNVLSAVKSNGTISAATQHVAKGDQGTR